MSRFSHVRAHPAHPSDPLVCRVLDTHRSYRHIATCLTAESAIKLKRFLNALKPSWRAHQGSMSTVIVASVLLPDGREYASSWHVSKKEREELTPVAFELMIMCVEDRLYGGVAAEHASAR